MILTFFSQNDIIFSVLLDTEKGESKMESNLIHSKLKMKGKNVEWLANEMTAYGQPISASTIYKKLKGEVVFKASDIKLISQLLDFNNEEIMTIFFSELVSKKTHIGVERIVMNEKSINKLFSICLIIFTIIGSNTSIISYAMDNESGTQIRSIAVEYPGEKTEIVATKDWATVSLSLGISELASGETMTLRMASEKYSYSMTPFEIGDALQVIPNDDGTWTIKALQTLTDYSADLQLKLRYNQNLSEDFEDQVVFTFEDSQKIVKINIGQYVEKVPPTELVRKVPLGFTSEGRIAWVIYFNYNQAGLSGSEKTTFKFLDNVGPNQTLAIDSIAAYLTKQPILETNGEMIRNLEHDEYSYDASQFFQKNASESGFNYEAEKFEGIPTATGSYLSNKNAYYIYLETIPNENIPSDAVLSNYTYMRISSEGFDAWEDDDIAYITADESSDGTGRGGVVLEKIDAVTAKVLEGAVFKVVNTKTQQVVQETLTTNQAGQIRLAGLEAGQYAFIETKAPTGYKLDATPVPFEIKLEQTQTIRLKKKIRV